MGRGWDRGYDNPAAHAHEIRQSNEWPTELEDFTHSEADAASDESTWMTTTNRSDTKIVERDCLSELDGCKCHTNGRDYGESPNRWDYGESPNRMDYGESHNRMHYGESPNGRDYGESPALCIDNHPHGYPQVADATGHGQRHEPAVSHNALVINGGVGTRTPTSKRRPKDNPYTAKIPRITKLINKRKSHRNPSDGAITEPSSTGDEESLWVPATDYSPTTSLRRGGSGRCKDTLGGEASPFHRQHPSYDDGVNGVLQDKSKELHLNGPHSGECKHQLLYKWAP